MARDEDTFSGEARGGAKTVLFLLLAVVLVGLVCVGAYLIRSRHRDPAAASQQRDPDPRLSKDDIDRTALRLAAQNIGNRDQAPPQIAPASLPAESPSPSAAEQFESQAREPDWASRVEYDIRSAFAGYPRSMLGAIECRTWICRVTAVHADSTAFALWNSSFSGSVKSAPHTVTRRTDRGDGSIQTEIYLAAPGHTVPAQ
jgi:hypothetical protein